MMTTRILATVAALGAASGAHAAILDFESFVAGDVLTQVMSDGVTIDISGTGGASGSVMVFDTDNFTGGDNDLKAPFYSDFDAPGAPSAGADTLTPGKVLIISEDDDATDPDDAGNGGSITFDFDSAVTFQGFDVLDDVSNFTVTGNGGLFTTGPINLDFDNQFASITGLDWAGVTTLTFDFVNASGAIDNIAFDVPSVPLPAGLPLMLAGLGVLGLAARRRKTA